jgi:hypothetical protein
MGAEGFACDSLSQGGGRRHGTLFDRWNAAGFASSDPTYPTDTTGKPVVRRRTKRRFDSLVVG